MEKKRAGFTLLELLIVVIIVGVLATLALPAYNAFVARGRLAEVHATLGAIKTGQLAFRQQNNGAYSGALVTHDAIRDTLFVDVPAADTIGWNYFTTDPEGKGDIFIMAMADNDPRQTGFPNDTLVIMTLRADGSSDIANPVRP